MTTPTEAPRRPPPAVAGYAAAVAIAAAAVLLRLALGEALAAAPFVTFFPAAVLAAHLCGTRAGLLTTGLCTLAGWALPAPAGEAAGQSEGVALAAYAVLSGLVAVVIGEGRSARRGEVEAERALREEQARARRALDSITEGFVLLDREFRVVDINAEALRLEGRPREAILGRTHWEAWPGSEGSELGRLYRRAMEERRPVELTHRFEWPDGRAAWLEMHAHGTGEGLAVFFRDVTEAQEAQEALRDTQRRLDAVLDNASVAIFLMDDRQHCVYMNAAAERLTGYALEETRGRALHDVIHHTRPDGSHFPREECAIDRAFPENNNMRGEEVFVHKDGHFYPVAFTASPIRDEASRTVGTIIEVQDITDRKRAEAALRESEERLDLAVRAHRIGIYDWDMRTGRLVWSEQQERLAGLEPGGFGGAIADWERLVVPEDLAAFREVAAQAVARRQEDFGFAYRLVRPDGELRHIEAAARVLYGPDGAPLRMVGTNIDATERRLAEAELKRLNDDLEGRVAEALAGRKLWADVFESSDAIIGAVDPGHRLLALNRACAEEFERIFGVRPKVGDRLEDLLAQAPEQLAAALAIWDRALAGEEFTVTEEFGDPDRARPCYELRFNTLRDREGRIVGAFQYGVDVTERLRGEARLAEAQEALRQSQKMESLGQLTGGIAHDFNNLLTGIIGSLDLLERRVSVGRTENLGRYTTVALASAKRAAAMTQRLLAFARRQALDPRPVDVNALVRSMEELIRRSVGERVTVETVLSGGLWATKVDPNQLESALVNLCVNARDAMPEGGRITIETANGHLDAAYAARVSEVRPGQYVVLSVTDTGTGMAPEVIRRAFEPFFTTKPIGQGTGLGLSQLHGFVKQSGGHVAIYSEVGQGTTIRIYLPRHHGPVEREAPEEPAAMPRSEARETVLVVEDEDTVRMLVVDVLDELGYTAREAVDAAGALPILESGERIDLLVTDVGLPGMNGRQLADRARELRPGLGVLFVTGYAHNAAVGNGLLEPGMEVVTKPFAVDHLAARIAAMVGRG